MRWAAKLNVREPDEPLYLLKAPTTAAAPNAVVRQPVSYDGKVAFEGELGIVIGRTCGKVSVGRADEFIFGYTCVNDITASDIIGKMPPLPNGLAPRGMTASARSGPSSARRSTPRNLWCEPFSTASSVRTIQFRI